MSAPAPIGNKAPGDWWISSSQAHARSNRWRFRAPISGSGHPFHLQQQSHQSHAFDCCEQGDALIERSLGTRRATATPFSSIVIANEVNLLRTGVILGAAAMIENGAYGGRWRSICILPSRPSMSPK